MPVIFQTVNPKYKRVVAGSSPARRTILRLKLNTYIKGVSRMTSTTFENSKVGDKVWSIDSGWGEIRARYGSVTYPLGVYFSNGEYRTYTLGGLYTEYDKTQSLFWDEIVNEVPAKPTTVLQVDAKKVSELRDHIAIAYMQSCVAGNAYFETFEGVSSEAYKMADAMLEERYKAMLAAVPEAEPVGFCEDTALSLAERTFSTEVDEQLAEDIIQYARRLHSRYTAPHPTPDVSGLVAIAREIVDLHTKRKVVLTVHVEALEEALDAYPQQGGDL